MIRISECAAPFDRWLLSKRPFAQLTYNQLHPISFVFRWNLSQHPEVCGKNFVHIFMAVRLHQMSN